MSCDVIMQGKVVVGTQNSEILEIEEKTGNLQVCTCDRHVMYM